MIELIQANLSWIVLGVVFLLMMRMHGGGMGRGAGHQHGTQPQERRPDQDGASPITASKDPVCDMEVDPKTAAATTEYAGRTYYFCSPGCKAVFEMNPEKFSQAQSGGHQHRMISGG